MNKDYTIHITPTKKELAIVKQWLYDEYLDNNRQFGFYCNWNLIEIGANENRVIIYLLKDKPVGITLWSEYKGQANIDIFVILPSLRRQGLGAMFAAMLNDYFQEINAFVIKLFCEPEESVSFWRDKLKYIQFPERGYSESSLIMYKPLISTTPYTTILDTPYRLELWDVEPWQSKKVLPRWVWKIDSDLINNPILHPCNYDWNLRLVKNSTVLKEDKVKYFEINAHSFLRGSFLYVDNLELD